MSPEPNSAQKHLMDDLVPSQWMDQVRAAFADVPERRLMIALLFDVIRALHGGSVKQRAEISAWIRGTNYARIPFNLLCDALELDPTCLARRLLHGRVTEASRFRARAKRRSALPTTTVNEPSVSHSGNVISAGASADDPDRDDASSSSHTSAP